jgi:(E)-4-hydroxy-3-methylbut-2-enyl-diphosphate synthase
MWKKPLAAVTEELLESVNSLENGGCEILRFAVPDMKTAEILGKLSQKTELPLVADIHFDYKIALKCLDYSIAKIRINPGNIGDLWKVEELIKKAKDREIPIRVGVNGGSLPKILKNEADKGLAMIKAAEMEMEILEKHDFGSVIFSLKSSDISDTIKANAIFSEKYPYPLHLGVTESGPLIQGTVKSSIALFVLLNNGIGDTVRVSLSDEPENEIKAALSILKNCGLRENSLEIVSCPTCGRTQFDVKGFLKTADPFFKELEKKRQGFTIAVMGCPVNGPGEAKNADFGITGTDKYAIIFRQGRIVKRVNSSAAFKAFRNEILKGNIKR